MERFNSFRVRSLIGVVIGVVPGIACADLVDLIPRLTNPIEIDAARANQAVYDSLTTPQAGRAPICDVSLRVDPGEGECSGATFRTFTNVRHLVQTANEILGLGPTEFSLRVDQRRLGFALRWTAAEELAAQGNAATRFSGSQLNSLASRISALRVGTRGLKVAYAPLQADEVFAASDANLAGGGASADDAEGLVKRWGGFIDGSAGNGRQDDTTNLANAGTEDAFDYDGLEVTGGIDYRVDPNTVLGLMVGYTRRDIDFDSTVSVVDGTIDSVGESVLVYALWERGGFYLSGSLGVQSLEHDLVRRITYASLNPLVPSVDETALSSTDSRTYMASFNTGYGWRFGGFSVEPFVRGEYQYIDIDGFSERDANGFDFAYDTQTISALDAAVGVKLQYVLTPSFGVVIPFLRGEAHRELGNDKRTIDAIFATVAAGVAEESAENFNIATNEPDDQFYAGAVGVSLVLKHGLQGFLQYQQTFGLDHIDDRAIAGGVRFEF